MNDFQVLVATMRQTDFSLADKMNLQSDAIIANQAKEHQVTEIERDYGHLKMITTPTRGVGLNRNIALLASDADIVLFSDDDMIYYDGLKENVKAAFQQLPQADMIIFGADIMKDNVIVDRRYLPIKKRTLWNSLQYGTYALAIRRDAVLHANLSFHQAFGGGCIYGSGEDSLFICDCFRKKLKVYSHSYVLGICVKDTSSWFHGFNQKYFFDKGAFLKCAFPGLYRMMMPALAVKMLLRRKTEISLWEMLRQMNAGAKALEKMIAYGETNDYEK